MRIHIHQENRREFELYLFPAACYFPFLPTSLERVLAEVPLACQARTLRELTYAQLGQAHRERCVWLHPPHNQLPPDIHTPVHLQRQWVSAWWTATPETFFPIGPLILGLRRRLFGVIVAFPLSHPTKNISTLMWPSSWTTFLSCPYVCAGTSAAPTHYSPPPVAPPRGCKPSHQVEQNILLADGTMKRADITALHSSGLNVMITGNLDPLSPCSAHLAAQEPAKA